MHIHTYMFLRIDHLTNLLWNCTWLDHPYTSHIHLQSLVNGSVKQIKCIAIDYILYHIFYVLIHRKIMHSHGTFGSCILIDLIFVFFRYDTVYIYHLHSVIGRLHFAFKRDLEYQHKTMLKSLLFDKDFLRYAVIFLLGIAPGVNNPEYNKYDKIINTLQISHYNKNVTEYYTISNFSSHTLKMKWNSN